MFSPVVILVLSFAFFLAMNVPIAVSIALATYLTVVAVGTTSAPAIIAQRMATGIDSFALLAIPFFILSGTLMGRGGMARRLIDFADALLGRLTGGLSFVNVLTCMMFGSISGSAVAAVSSIGGFMIPQMRRNGYDNDFSVAVSVAAATTGLVIPPSNIMIVYAVVTGSVSVMAMFLAGVLPGILIGVLLMAAAAVICRRKGYGRAATENRVGPRRLFRSFLGALPSLLLVVIVLGGILGGVFTPTEAAAVAVVYAFLLGVVFYREIKPSKLPEILLQTGVTTAVVMLLIGASQAMSWIMAYEQIPQSVSAALLGLSSDPLVILLVINAILLLVGTFMDMTPAVLIFTPIFLPVVTGGQIGMDPVHFGIVMIVNLCIGICTPPVGTCLFVGCGVGGTTLARVTPKLLPFYAAMLAALAIIAGVPALSLWLPRSLGY
jgi:tripartite ATP-independent transporter DctM subunit